MKYLTLLALLGCLSHTEATSVTQHQAQLERLMANEADSDDSDDTSEADVLLNVEPEHEAAVKPHPIATTWNDEKPHPGYEANHDDFEGYEGFGNYDRQVPVHFDGPGTGDDRDDQFMNSMITKYALELATPEGAPTGEFVFKYVNARQAAWEILDTHMGLKGKDADKYMDEYFDKTWKHFDTAGDGKIEAARMSGFFRFLCGNMLITLH